MSRTTYIRSTHSENADHTRLIILGLDEDTGAKYVVDIIEFEDDLSDKPNHWFYTWIKPRKENGYPVTACIEFFEKKHD